MTQIESAEILRKQWAQSDALRDSRIPDNFYVNVISDIPYVNDKSKWHLTDIYYPKSHGIEKLPVIVSIHGGGWFYGDKELYRLYTKYLATFGFAVVNFNYRLAPENKYPCGFYDVLRLFDFLYSEQEKYDLDLNRLYVVGDSAGAQLASQYGIYSTNESYRRLFEFKVNSPVPAKIALNCGVYEFSERNGDEISKWYTPDVMDENTKESLYNIRRYMNSDFPESFVMCSVNDPLAPGSLSLVKLLKEYGIRHIYKEYGQNDKSEGHVFHINIISKEAQRCNSDEIKFFRD